MVLPTKTNHGSNTSTFVISTQFFDMRTKDISKKTITEKIDSVKEDGDDGRHDVLYHMVDDEVIEVDKLVMANVVLENNINR